MMLFCFVTPVAVAAAIFATYHLRPISPTRLGEEREEIETGGARERADGNAKEAQAELDELNELKETGQGHSIAAEWEYLGVVPEYLGPGSTFQAFYGRLQEEAEQAQPSSDYTCPLHYIGTPTLMPVLHFNSTVTGEGKVVSELVVQPSLDDHLAATLTFKASPAADLNRARQNRDERVLQVARALGLTRDEIRRLRAVLGILPIPSSRLEDGPNMALSQLLSEVPSRVRREFLDTWQAWSNEKLARGPLKVFSNGSGPAIGFPLSEDRIADVGFCLFDPMLIHHGAKPYEFGPWWSIALWQRQDTSQTDSKQTVSAGDITIKAWPRLTLTEVDAIVRVAGDAEWLRVDAHQNALDYLEMAHRFISEVAEDRWAWKWACIALHGALYSFAICALEQGNVDNVLKQPRQGKGIGQKTEGQAKPKKVWLISFGEAMERCQDPVRMGQRRALPG